MANHYVEPFVRCEAIEAMVQRSFKTVSTRPVIPVVETLAAATWDLGSGWFLDECGNPTRIISTY